MEPGFGVQPGYPSVCFTSAPDSLKTLATILHMSSWADSTELRWLVVRTTLVSVIMTDARLVDVSTKLGISADHAITP